MCVGGGGGGLKRVLLDPNLVLRFDGSTQLEQLPSTHQTYDKYIGVGRFRILGGQGLEYWGGGGGGQGKPNS